MDRQIFIHDSTLREGHQSRLWNFTTEEKLFISHLLKNLWVDSMEVWFWWASKKEDEEISLIVNQVWLEQDSPVMASLTWLDKSFVEKTMISLKNARKKRICLLTSGSDQHINVKFSWKWNNHFDRKKSLLDLISENTRFAVSSWYEVQLTTEDSISADKDYLLDSIIVAIEAWASVINLPDTLWKWYFYEIEDLFRFLSLKTQYLKDKWYNFIFSTHHHNDMWLATANNLSAIRWWACAIETTLLWIWDRVWISSLEETILNIYEKSKTIIPWERLILSRFNKRLIWPAIRALSKILGTAIDPNAPLIWSNNNVHWAWIHNAANNKWKKLWEDVNIYESISLSDYWFSKPSRVLSATWWRGEVLSVLSSYGINLQKDDKIVKDITEKYKEQATYTKWVYPAKVYSFYLQETWDFVFNDEDIKISWNTVEISMILFWKKIVLKWEWEWSNWVADATINALNNFFIENKCNFRVSISSFYEKVKFSIWEVVDNYNKDVEESDHIYIPESEDDYMRRWSKKVIIVNLSLYVNWEKTSIRSVWQNAELSSIKWIIKWSLYYIWACCKKMK